MGIKGHDSRSAFNPTLTTQGFLFVRQPSEDLAVAEVQTIEVANRRNERSSDVSEIGGESDDRRSANLVRRR
jgi:hypothetical protein